LILTVNTDYMAENIILKTNNYLLMYRLQKIKE